jgi:AcrR family transcriptional regulator
MTGDIQRYASYKDQFQFSGEQIYELIYERNKTQIRTKRRSVALVNLKRIFEHTFRISRRDGFREMSLRQLSHESGISIGGIYACIESKQALAQMACDCVTYIGVQHLQSTVVPRQQPATLAEFLRNSAFLAELMHEWLHFVFVDVRSMRGTTESEFSRLTSLFVAGVDRLSSLQDGRPADGEVIDRTHALEARLALLLIGDWVQRREQFLREGHSIDTYADYVVATLSRDSDQSSPAPNPGPVEALSGVDVI